MQITVFRRERGEEPERRPRRRRPVALVAAVAVALVAAVVARAATEPDPPVRVAVLLQRTVTAPGSPVPLTWPAQGEAALAYGDGTIIGSAGGDSPMPIASIAKVMVALLVLTDHPLPAGQAGFDLTITPAEAATLPAREAEGQSILSVHAGEVLTERQALQALLLASADNIADSLADAGSGSVAAFAARMNAEAAALGMTGTHFGDASGYDRSTVSTPTDLLRLARAAMALPAFASIVDESSADLPGVGSVSNYNSLVGTDGFTGIKTGSTRAAGQALLFSVTRTVAGRDVTVLGAVLEQHGAGVVGQALASARSLADSLFSQLALRTIVPAGAPAATVSRAQASAVLRTTAPLELVSQPGAAVHLAVSVGRPRGAGAASGTVTASGPAASSSVGTDAVRLPEPSWSWRIRHLFG